MSFIPFLPFIVFSSQRLRPFAVVYQHGTVAPSCVLHGGRHLSPLDTGSAVTGAVHGPPQALSGATSKRKFGGRGDLMAGVCRLRDARQAPSARHCCDRRRESPVLLRTLPPLHAGPVYVLSPRSLCPRATLFIKQDKHPRSDQRVARSATSAGWRVTPSPWLPVPSCSCLIARPAVCNDVQRRRRKHPGFPQMLTPRLFWRLVRARMGCSYPPVGSLFQNGWFPRHR